MLFIWGIVVIAKSVLLTIQYNTLYSNSAYLSD